MCMNPRGDVDVPRQNFRLSDAVGRPRVDRVAVAQRDKTVRAPRYRLVAGVLAARLRHAGTPVTFTDPPVAHDGPPRAMASMTEFGREICSRMHGNRINRALAA